MQRQHIPHSPPGSHTVAFHLCRRNQGYLLLTIRTKFTGNPFNSVRDTTWGRDPLLRHLLWVLRETVLHSVSNLERVKTWVYWGTIQVKMCPERDQQFYEPQMRLSEQHGDTGYSADASNSIFCFACTNRINTSYSIFRSSFRDWEDIGNSISAVPSVVIPLWGKNTALWKCLHYFGTMS